MADVDKLMADDRELRKRMTRDLRECLEEAGYEARALAMLDELEA